MKIGDLVKYTGLNGDMPEGSLGIVVSIPPYGTEVFWGNGARTAGTHITTENVLIPNSSSPTNFAEIMRY